MRQILLSTAEFNVLCGLIDRIEPLINDEEVGVSGVALFTGEGSIAYKKCDVKITIGQLEEVPF